MTRRCLTLRKLSASLYSSAKEIMRVARFLRSNLDTNVKHSLLLELDCLCNWSEQTLKWCLSSTKLYRYRCYRRKQTFLLERTYEARYVLIILLWTSERFMSLWRWSMWPWTRRVFLFISIKLNWNKEENDKRISFKLVDCHCFQVWKHLLRNEFIFSIKSLI